MDRKEIRTERPNLFEPNDTITFYVELSGKVRTEDLAKAVRAAYRANEATMSKIVLCKDGTAYYEKMPESNCRVEVAQGEWQEILRANEKKPFDLAHGELIRCFIFPGEEKLSFMIMAHHLAGDGKAITYFIEGILTALSGGELAYMPLELLTPYTIPKTGKYSFAAKQYTKYCNRKWMKMGNPVFSWEDYDKIYKRYWETVSSYVPYRQFSKEETARIKKNAKRASVSVNSYIITAFLQADSKNRVVGIPLSVRESGNKSMTNLTSGIQIVHSFAEHKTFSENAKQIHKKVSRKLEAHRWFVLRFLSDLLPALIDGVLLYTHHCYDNGLTSVSSEAGGCLKNVQQIRISGDSRKDQTPDFSAAGLLIGRLAEVMGYTGKNIKDLGITNLTVLDIPAVYGKTTIEKMIFVPPNVSYSHNIIGISTFREEMTITYHGTEDGKEEQKDFFDRGINHLLFHN